METNKIFRVFLMSAAMCLCLAFGASAARAQQCGLPGLPPCPSKSKAKTPTVSKPKPPPQKAIISKPKVKSVKTPVLEVPEKNVGYVKSIHIDRDIVVMPCNISGSIHICEVSKLNQIINVSTDVFALDDPNIQIRYTVTGGQIYGSGTNVQWDLTSAKPGKYTITASVANVSGYSGGSPTKLATVDECQTCNTTKSTLNPISVIPPPESIYPGDMMTFVTVISSAGYQPNVTYNWSVSNGTIVEGQGTPIIKVSTAGLQLTYVTATVYVGGLCPSCQSTASQSGFISELSVPIIVQEIEGPEPFLATQNRVENFFKELAKNPSARGTIINYGTDKEVAYRINDIIKAGKSLDYNINIKKIRFVRGGSDPGIRTRFFIVPPNADEPQP